MTENGRPSCFYCGKPLRLLTWMMEEVQKGETPKVFRSRFSSRNEGKPVLKVTRRSGRGETETLTVWLGEYMGYGRMNNWEAPLFCTQGCGVQMGMAAVRAGWRIKGRKA